MFPSGRDGAGKSDPRHLALLALLIITLTGFAYHEVFDFGIHGGDFLIIFDAARALRKGLSEYAAPAGEVRYVYSPLVALALHPMARMSPDHAIQLWFFIEIGFFLLAIALFARSAGIGLSDSAALATLFLVAFYSRPTWLEFRHGQFNAPLLALAAGAYLADRRGQFYRLAGWVAVAALIKTWMIGLLVYLLVRRRPQAYLAGLGFYAAGLLCLFTIVGWSEAAAFWRITVTFLHRNNDFSNQSILGFARVRFAAGSAALPIVDSRIALYGFVALCFAALAYGLACAYRAGKNPSPLQSRLLLSLAIVSLLLAVPNCERYYFVLLFPPIWTLLTAAATPNWARWATITIYFVFTFSFVPPPHTAAGWQSWSCSAFFFGAAALWAVLLWMIQTQSRREP